ncbi:glycosyl transferase family protein [Psychromonas sp. CNPT3]|uniref:glycosyltransferase family 2 protein n=1 Tax=Psychromonas sp. CNPT3 TaxID=314282 RepID=UPI00006E582C|nr:glycosyltransferase family 2 protein [Psychromonas sp. CNPT3]AGH80465.1 glycosyl transferase family protein [Psychromonas sp. CNPT3]
MPNKISAIIITKNEQDNLPSCLDSLHWVDEIIIVDSGSQDKTQEIALSYNAKFYSHPDWQGFGKQKQLAQHYASNKWIIAIDADEVVSSELQASIQHAITDAPHNTIFKIIRKTWVFGRFLEHSGWVNKIVRVYPKNIANYNDALVHEKVVSNKNVDVKILDGDLLHYSYGNITDYLVKSASYSKAWADSKQQEGKKGSLCQAISHALSCFFKMYLLRRGFLDGKQGFIIAILCTHYVFAKYTDLWIRENDPRQK